MDNIKNMKNDVNEDYFKVCQLIELITDIEVCASNLVLASKKAKMNFENFKNEKYKELVT